MQKTGATIADVDTGTCAEQIITLFIEYHCGCYPNEVNSYSCHLV